MQPHQFSAQPIIDSFLRLSIKQRKKLLAEKKMKVFLYKYSPFNKTEYSKSIICESKLWMSSPDAFNDPFDMKWKYLIEKDPVIRRKRIEQILKNNRDLAESSWIKRKAQIEKMMADPKGLEKNIRDASRKNVSESGVVCFSQDPRSILMWSHYANHHKGIVYQFDVSLDPATFLKAVRVEYSKQYPVIEWTDPQENALKVGLLRKFDAWSYEEEKRLFRPHAANTHLYFKPDALSGIILGSKFTNEGDAILRELLGKRCSLGFAMPLIYNAIQDESDYKLRILNAEYKLCV